MPRRKVERTETPGPTGGAASAQLRQAKAVALELGLTQVVFELRDDRLIARGLAPNPTDRQRLLDRLERLPGVGAVVDRLELSWGGPLPDASAAGTATDGAAGGESSTASDTPQELGQAEPGHLDAGNAEGLEPDFTDTVGTTSELTAVEEGVPYFPPTDPVVRPEHPSHEGAEVLGGFQPTAMDDTDLVSEATTGGPADVAIAEAVQRELREDALTTDLPIRIVVRAGVVSLRGVVPSLELAEAAEEVAARVEGVTEVVDELEVQGLT
jgi:hypothetical protein